MSHNRVWAAALLGAAVLLAAPATGSAQVMIGRVGIAGTPYYGYYPGMSLYYPSYYSYGYYPYGWGYSPGYAYYYPRDWYGNPWSLPGTVTTDYAAPTTPYRYGSTDTSGYYTSGGAASNTVKLNVRVPDPDAQVWVEGQLTQQRGRTREYTSPPINPDRNYVYEVRARWVENGRTMDETKRLPANANDSLTVDFGAPTNHSRIDEIK
jgi:uncharacterized protein (TIGR03000 family)